jgi:hypothetical protein
MGKMKDLILDHRGYTISGIVYVELWGGDTVWLGMNVSFIPSHELSHNKIKQCINDGGFGCKSILEAKITIFDTYGNQHLEVINRVMTLNSKQCFDGTRGIKRDPVIY